MGFPMYYDTKVTFQMQKAKKNAFIAIHFADSFSHNKQLYLTACFNPTFGIPRFLQCSHFEQGYLRNNIKTKGANCTINGPIRH